MTAVEEVFLSKIGEDPSKCVFRGQAKSYWKLHSTATRRLIKFFNDDECVIEESQFSQMHLVYHRSVLLEPARTLGFGSDSGQRMSDLQLLAKLQHFGAATALIDFTWDPLVALWFACEESSCDGRVFILDLSDCLRFQEITSDVNAQSAEEIFAPINGQGKQLYCKKLVQEDEMQRVRHQGSVSLIGSPLIPDEIVRSVVISASEKALIRSELESLLDINTTEPLADIRRFAAENSAIFPLPQVEDSEFYRIQGNQCYERGEYHDAISYYDRFVELAPDECLAYALRGNAKSEIGDYCSASEDYGLAILKNKRPREDLEVDNSPVNAKKYFNWPFYFNRGNVKAELNDLEGALEDYNETVRLCQKVGLRDPSVFLNRGNINAQLHLSEDAINDFDDAILFGSLVARFNKGNFLVFLGRFDEALQCYEESVGEGSDQSALICNRNGVEAILNRLGGSGYVIHPPQNQGAPGRMTVEVSLRTSDNNMYRDFFNFHGNVGNAGNTGEDGLPNGKGYRGNSGFVVLIRGQKWE